MPWVSEWVQKQVYVPADKLKLHLARQALEGRGPRPERYPTAEEERRMRREYEHQLREVQNQIAADKERKARRNRFGDMGTQDIIAQIQREEHEKERRQRQHQHDREHQLYISGRRLGQGSERRPVYRRGW